MHIAILLTPQNKNKRFTTFRSHNATVRTECERTELGPDDANDRVGAREEPDVQDHADRLAAASFVRRVS